jgi:hypothetical protein
MIEFAKQRLQHTQHTQHAHRTIPPAQTYAIYEEDCWIARVLIVADRSDAVFERCTLQVIEHLRSVPSLPTPRIGDMFEHVWQRGGMCSGIGRLTRV